MSGRQWGIVAIFTVAGLLTLLLAVGFEAIEDPSSALSIALVGLATVVMFVGWRFRPGPRLPWLCDPLLLGFAFLAQFYVVGALGYHMFGSADLPFMRPFAPWRTVQASAAFLLFVTTMLAGYMSRVGPALERFAPDTSRASRRVPLVWLETAVLSASFLGCLAWLDFQGGLLAKLSEGYSAGKAGGAMFVIAHQGMVCGTLLMAWRIFSKPSILLRDQVVLGTVLVFNAIFLGLIFGVRKYLFFLFFGLVTIWILRRGWASLPKLRVAALLAGLLVFFSIWGAIRANSVLDMVQGKRDARVAQNAGDVRPYIGSVSDPYAVACLVWDLFPQVEPFRHGRTMLVTVLGFIPRAVWQDKPIGIGKELTRYIVGPYYEEYYGFSVTVTMPADLYLNFGWLGVTLGGLLLGIASRAVTEYASRGAVGNLQLDAARVLAPAVFLITLAELRADLSVMLATFLLTSWPILLGLVFFRMHPRAASASAWPARSAVPARLT